MDDGIGAKDIHGGIADFPRVLSEERGFTLIELLVVVTMPFRKRSFPGVVSLPSSPRQYRVGPDGGLEAQQLVPLLPLLGRE